LLLLGVVVGFLFSIGFLQCLTSYWMIMLMGWSVGVILYSISSFSSLTTISSSESSPLPLIESSPQEWLHLYHEREDFRKLERERISFDLPQHDQQNEDDYHLTHLIQTLSQYLPVVVRNLLPPSFQQPSNERLEEDEFENEEMIRRDEEEVDVEMGLLSSSSSSHYYTNIQQEEEDENQPLLLPHHSSSHSSSSRKRNSSFDITISSKDKQQQQQVEEEEKKKKEENKNGCKEGEEDGLISRTGSRPSSSLSNSHNNNNFKDQNQHND